MEVARICRSFEELASKAAIGGSDDFRSVGSALIQIRPKRTGRNILRSISCPGGYGAGWQWLTDDPYEAYLILKLVGASEGPVR